MQDNHLRAMGGDVARYSLLQTLSKLGDLLLLPILSRILSIEEYGLVDLLALGIVVCESIFKFGIPAAVMRFTAEKHRGLFSTALLIVACWSTLVSLPVVALAEDIGRRFLDSAASAHLVVLAAGIAIFESLRAVAAANLRVNRRIASFGIVSLLTNLLFVGLAVLFVAKGDRGVEGILIARLVSSTASLAISLWLTRTDLEARPSKHAGRLLIRFGSPLVPGRLATALNQQADRLLIATLLTLADLGLYGIAYRIVQIGSLPLVAAGKAWMPYAMRIVRRPDRNMVYTQFFSLFVVCSSMLAILVVGFAPELLELLVPPELHRAFWLTPWLVVASVLRTSALFSRLGLVIESRTHEVSVAATVAAAIHVGVALIAIPRFGLAGAALALCLGELTNTSWLAVRSHRCSGIRLNGVIAAAALLATVTSFAISLTTIHWLGVDGSRSIRCVVLIMATLLGLFIAKGVVSSPPLTDTLSDDESRARTTSTS